MLPRLWKTQEVRAQVLGLRSGSLKPPKVDPFYPAVKGVRAGELRNGALVASALRLDKVLLRLLDSVPAFDEAQSSAMSRYHRESTFPFAMPATM